MFHGEVHGASLVATLRIELHSLVDLALALEVLGTLNLDGLR